MNYSFLISLLVCLGLCFGQDSQKTLPKNLFLVENEIYKIFLDEYFSTPCSEYMVYTTPKQYNTVSWYNPIALVDKKSINNFQSDEIISTLFLSYQGYNIISYMLLLSESNIVYVVNLFDTSENQNFSPSSSAQLNLTTVLTSEDDRCYFLLQIGPTVGVFCRNTNGTTSMLLIDIKTFTLYGSIATIEDFPKNTSYNSIASHYNASQSYFAFISSTDSSNVNLYKLSTLRKSFTAEKILIIKSDDFTDASCNCQDKYFTQIAFAGNVLILTKNSFGVYLYSINDYRYKTNCLFYNNILSLTVDTQPDGKFLINIYSPQSYYNYHKFFQFYLLDSLECITATDRELFYSSNNTIRNQNAHQSVFVTPKFVVTITLLDLTDSISNFVLSLYKNNDDSSNIYSEQIFDNNIIGYQFDEYDNTFVLIDTDLSMSFYQMQESYLELNNIESGFLMTLYVKEALGHQTSELIDINVHAMKESDENLYSTDSENRVISLGEEDYPLPVNFYYFDYVNGPIQEVVSTNYETEIFNLNYDTMDISLFSGMFQHGIFDPDFKIYYSKMENYNEELLLIVQGGNEFDPSQSFLDVYYCETNKKNSYSCEGFDTVNLDNHLIDAYTYEDKLILITDESSDFIFIFDIELTLTNFRQVKIDYKCVPQFIQEIYSINYGFCVGFGYDGNYLYWMDMDALLASSLDEENYFSEVWLGGDNPITDIYPLQDYVYDYIVKFQNNSISHVNTEFISYKTGLPLYYSKITALDQYLVGKYDIVVDSDDLYVINYDQNFINQFAFQQPYNYTLIKSIPTYGCKLNQINSNQKVIKDFLFVVASCSDQQYYVMAYQPDLSYRQSYRGKLLIGRTDMISVTDSWLTTLASENNTDICTLILMTADIGKEVQILTLSVLDDPYIAFNLRNNSYNRTLYYAPSFTKIHENIFLNSLGSEKSSLILTIDNTIRFYMNIIAISPQTEFIEWTPKVSTVTQLNGLSLNYYQVKFSSILKSHVVSTVAECGSSRSRASGNQYLFYPQNCSGDSNDIFIPNNAYDETILINDFITLKDITDSIISPFYKTYNNETAYESNIQITINGTMAQVNIFQFSSFFDALIPDTTYTTNIFSSSNNSLYCNYIIGSQNSSMYYIFCNDIFRTYLKTFFVLELQTPTMNQTLQMNIYELSDNTIYNQEEFSEFKFKCIGLNYNYLTCLSMNFIQISVMDLDNNSVNYISFVQLNEKFYNQTIKDFDAIMIVDDKNNKIIDYMIIFTDPQYVYHVTKKFNSINQEIADGWHEDLYNDDLYTGHNFNYISIIDERSDNNQITFLLGSVVSDYLLSLDRFNSNSLQTVANFVRYGSYIPKKGHAYYNFAVFRSHSNLLLYPLESECNMYLLTPDLMQQCNDNCLDRNMLSLLRPPNNFSKILGYDITPSYNNDQFCQEYLFYTVAFPQNSSTGKEGGATYSICLSDFFTVIYTNVSDTAFRLNFSNDYSSGSTEIYFTKFNFTIVKIIFYSIISLVSLVFMISCGCFINQWRNLRKQKRELSMEAFEIYNKLPGEVHTSKAKR